MKTNYKVGIALVTGVAIGGPAIQGLHAQAKPPVYVIAQVDVSNPDAYAKEYVPKVMAISKAAGVRYRALGGKVTTLEGPPPRSRVVIQVWDSLEQLQALRNSAECQGSEEVSGFAVAIGGKADMLFCTAYVRL